MTKKVDNDYEVIDSVCAYCGVGCDIAAHVDIYLKKNSDIIPAIQNQGILNDHKS
jgi:predicted molibdopterin-dependent oxidoreductase YjgC